MEIFFNAFNMTIEFALHTRSTGLLKNFIENWRINRKNPSILEASCSKNRTVPKREKAHIINDLNCVLKNDFISLI